MNPPEIPQVPQEPQVQIDPEEFLRRKFPDMKPMGGTPSLFTLNGFGLSMVGQRDLDPETGTYVKTHCITALFIPILTLGAYRVADAEDGGWYFLGKVPKSGFARAWNTMILAAIVLSIGLGVVNSRKNSPEYKAAQHLEEAGDHASEGDYLKAAAVYRSMIQESLPSSDQAKEGLRTVLTQALESESAETVVAAVKFTANLSTHRFGKEGPVPEIDRLVLEGAERFSASQPEDALAILVAATKLPLPPENLAKEKEHMLLRLVTADPGKTEYVVALAGVYEETGRVDEAFALLEPHADKLGTGEGTRILGQLYLARGQAAEAVPLLEKYIEPQLRKWRAAEKKYNLEAEAAYNRVVDKLNQNQGPRSFYDKYNRATSEEEEVKILDEYVYGQMQQDARFLRAGREYEEAGNIVPVIMDLGISQLQAAQAITEPAKRKALLDKAEQRFLSLKETAGESDEFKFFLGQVYYWSGRQDEGRELFDALLTSSDRGFGTLLTLSSTLREIGNVAESRALAEEAYGKASKDEERDQAASQRALLSTDLDDEIKWLEKMTGGSLSHTTLLAGARAHQAEADGNIAEAIKQLRIAESGWAKLPVSSSTLNNGALVQFSLFSHTGDFAHHEAGSRMMERAVALHPENSILLGNAASSLAGTAMMRLAKDKLHPRIIQDGVGFEALGFLYEDEGSWLELTVALASDETFVRAMELLDRALLLSPNSQDLYGLAAAFRGYVFDLEALERLTVQLQSARFDHSAAMAEHESFMRGETDDTLRDGMTTGVERLGELIVAVEDQEQRRHVEVNMAAIRLSLFTIGEVADLGKEIALLRRAAQEDPCMRHRNVLAKALSQQACLSLAAESPAFAKLLESCRRYADVKSILALALSSEKLRPVVLANSAARDALAEEVGQDDLFPATRAPESVILVSAFAPDRLGDARRQLEENRAYHLGAKVSSVLAPGHPSAPLRDYFLLTAEGKEAAAAAVLEKARAAGTEVPAL